MNNLLADNIYQALGKVPTIKMKKIHSICKEQNLFLKLESCNPSGSIKIKNAAFLVKMAQENGDLKENGTIIESSSGNFGIGLAIIGAIYSYKVLIVVDAKTSPTMRKMLNAYGATLIDVPLTAADENGSMQVARMQRAKELAKEIPNSWYPGQHTNPLNPTAHYELTAQEIIHTFSGVAPDAIVVGISTAGQVSGISKFFKKNYPNTKIIGVDVAGSVIFGQASKPYKMTGLGLSFIPPNFNWDLIDQAYNINDTLAFSLCHIMAQKEGLLLGGSTGAIVAAGLHYATIQKNKNTKILMINPDSGDRYLDTIYNNQWLNEQKINIIDFQSIEEEIKEIIPIISK